jgi:hypothetical protein
MIVPPQVRFCIKIFYLKISENSRKKFNWEEPKRIWVLLGSVLFSFLGSGSVRVLDSWVPVRVRFFARTWVLGSVPVRFQALVICGDFFLVENCFVRCCHIFLDLLFENGKCQEIFIILFMNN